MKLPSLNFLFNSAIKSIVRFPLSLLAAFASTLIGVYLIENQMEWDASFPYLNAMLCLGLGIPLFFCVDIFVMKLGLGKTWLWALSILVMMALVGLYFTLPGAGETHNTLLPYIRYATYNVIAHLLVAFVPYTRSAQLNGFWNYNKILFLRFLTALLYSGVMYLGLVLALASLNFFI